jgi:hypothetical protein
MRQRFSSVFVAFVAVMAVGAVASASASASAWFVGGTELAASTSLASKATVLEKVKLTSAGVTIVCSAESVELNTASIAPKTGGQIAHLVLKECQSEAAGCPLESSQITSKPLVLEAALGSKSPEDTLVLKPATGTIVAEYAFIGESCGLAGVVQLKGKMKFVMPKGREELAEQELLVRAGEGELKSGSAEVVLGGKIKAKLTSAKAWSFH